MLLSSLQAQDFDGVAATLDDNLVYQNVGFPTIRGRARAMKLFRGMEGRLGSRVKTHRIAVNGSTVLTERTDALVIGPVRLQFWVCGVFEVSGGRITLWRDYFDMWDMAKALARGCSERRSPRCVPPLQRRALDPTRRTQLLERLRPPEQSIGGVDELVAVTLLDHRGTGVGRRDDVRRGGDHLVVLAHSAVGVGW